MKKLNLLLILFLCLFVTIGRAQLIPDVNPSNITETVDLIFELHGDQIELDYSEVYDFLDDLLPSGAQYDPSYSPPIAFMDVLTDSTISYVWDSIPGVYGYQASFLKIGISPDPSPETASLTVIDPTVEFTTTNGLLLSVFQSKASATSVGDIKVIIVDKPVFFEQSTEDCECEHPGTMQTSEFGDNATTNENTEDVTTNDMVEFDYTHNGNIGYYSMDIMYEDSTISTFLVKVEFIEGIIKVEKVCEINTYNEINGNILYSVSEENVEDVKGGVTFSEGIDFFTVNETAGNVALVECLPHGRGREGTLAGTFIQDLKLDAMPNPARNAVTIMIPQHFNFHRHSCVLADALGNRIRLPAYSYNRLDGILKLNTSQLPVGVYSLMIHSEQTRMKTRFIVIH